MIPQKRKVGYMFQDYALFPNMTVEKNIMAGMGRKPQKEIVQDYIRRFRLEGLEHHLPRQLSGGAETACGAGPYDGITAGDSAVG